MTTHIQPSFSVCIPNFNNGAYIGDTIESVLQQSYQDFEIIIVDNASTDNSVEIIKRYQDPRIRFYQNKYNIGFAPNLQRASQYAEKQFINLLSADDQMKPNALENYAKILKEQGERAEQTVLFSQVENFDNAGNITSYTIKATNDYYNDYSKQKPLQREDLIEHELFRGHEVLANSLKSLKNFAPFLSVVYSRKLWQEVEGYNAVRTIGPDKFFHFKLLELDPDVIYVKRILFRYRDFQSLNRTSQHRTLKQAMDDYLYTLEYDDKRLKVLGLSQNDLMEAFIDRVCLKTSLQQFRDKNYHHACQLLAFALAAYPEVTVKNPKFYAALFFGFMGPFSNIIAPYLLPRQRLVKD